MERQVELLALMQKCAKKNDGPPGPPFFLARRDWLFIRPVARLVPSFAFFRKVKCCANQSDM
jgi:hypothetical protein